MASEATTPLPVPLPPTLEELIAEHNALVARQNALVDVGNRKAAALCRELAKARMAPEPVVSGMDLYHAMSSIRDVQQEARENAERICASVAVIAEAGTWRTLLQMREQQAELAAPTEAAPRRHRKPRTARQPGTRPLRSLGAAVPAGAGLRAAFGGIRLRPPPLHTVLGHKLLMAKVLLAAGASTALVAVVVNMPASRTLEDRFSLGNHPSASVPYIGPWGAERITLPSSAPTAYVRPSLSPKPVVTLAAVPVEVPVVPVPQVTASQTDPSSQTYQPDTSSGSSQTYQPSGQSQPSQPDQSSSWSQSSGSQLPDLQAHGKHAAQDSGEGNSGYQGSHAGISLDGSGQNGSGHGGRWQNGSQQGGQQQNGGWQNGNGQNANWQNGIPQSGGGLGGVLQGTGFGQGGHGQHGGW